MSTAPIYAPHRDTMRKAGRPKSGTSYFTVPGTVGVSATTTGPVSANFDYYAALYVDSPMVFDQMAIEVTTIGGTNVRIGLYAADVNWQPTGPPLADSGNLSSAGTGVKTYTPSTPVYLASGRYLSVYNCDGTAVFRMTRGDFAGDVSFDQALGASPLISTWRVGRTLAAFPTPGTAWTTTTANNTTSNFNVVFFRVTAL